MDFCRDFGKWSFVFQKSNETLTEHFGEIVFRWNESVPIQQSSLHFQTWRIIECQIAVKLYIWCHVVSVLNLKLKIQFCKGFPFNYNILMASLCFKVTRACFFSRKSLCTIIQILLHAINIFVKHRSLLKDGIEVAWILAPKRSASLNLPNFSVCSSLWDQNAR